MTTEYEVRGRHSKGNRYIMVENDVSSRCVLIECVWFCGKEDTGDLIFCTREGQQIWVAKGIFDFYSKFEV